MCGIAGFLGRFDAGRLPDMAARLAHRGPDDEGIYYDSSNALGLVHRRLSIQDLSAAGHQPMWDPAGEIAIIFNGEIYNFRELRAELKSDGVSFHGHSDTEVILQLYRCEGMDMLLRLNGVFACAIWDARICRLFLFRDGLGVKPLYIAESKYGIVFASEIKALLVHPEIERQLDPGALAAHMTFLWSPAPRTMLRAVRKLEPGYALEIEAGRVRRRWRFYDLPYSTQTPFAGSETDAVGALTNALQTAVRRQLVSDVPVGAFLSGGLDSSSVVALARQAEPDYELRCFTVSLEGTDAGQDGVVEDLPYARKVAEHLGVSLQTIHAGSNMLERLPEMIWHLDEPQADPAPLNALLISELARENGIKVLLSGAGGDDILTGYRRHWALDQERYWSWLPRSVLAMAMAVARHLPSRNPRLRRIAKAMRYMTLPDEPRIASYFYWLDPSTSMSLLHPNFIGSLVADDVAAPLLESLERVADEPERLNRMLYLEAKHFLADHNLNYTDKISMAAGVEVRVPLLDTDLIALATRLPVSMKQRGREGKWLFKKAMEPYLPHDVIYRPKTGFGAPLRSWLNKGKRDMVEDLLSESVLRDRGIFEPGSVRRLLADDRAGRSDATYSIFGIMCVEIWCRQFIDADGAPLS